VLNHPRAASPSTESLLLFVASPLMIWMQRVSTRKHQGKSLKMLSLLLVNLRQKRLLLLATVL
jgi:hypothetical protein